jgi:hypothetical protein
MPTTRDLYFVGWKRGKRAAARDLRAFERQVRSIADLAPKSAWYVDTCRFIYQLPLWTVMHLFPDKMYQNFQLAWFRAPLQARLKVLGKRLIS